MSFTAVYTPLYPLEEFDQLAFDDAFAPDEHDWLDEHDIDIGSLAAGDNDDGPYIDAYASVNGNGVRITDLDGLEDALNDTMRDQMVTSKSYDRDAYPAQEWQTLHGFLTWGEVDSDNYIEADNFNIERLGFTYSHSDAVDFWSKVSQHTEPFVAYNSPKENAFPDTLDALARGGAEVFRFVGVDGEVVVTEIEFGITGGETL